MKRFFLILFCFLSFISFSNSVIFDGLALWPDRPSIQLEVIRQIDENISEPFDESLLPYISNVDDIKKYNDLYKLYKSAPEIETLSYNPAGVKILGIKYVDGEFLMLNEKEIKLLKDYKDYVIKYFPDLANTRPENNQKVELINKIKEGFTEEQIDEIKKIHNDMMSVDFYILSDFIREYETAFKIKNGGLINIYKKALEHDNTYNYFQSQGALNAALASLFPPTEINKFNLTVGFGANKSVAAVAVGVGYKTEHIGIRAGLATDKDVNIMYNGAFNFVF